MINKIKKCIIKNKLLIYYFLLKYKIFKNKIIDFNNPQTYFLLFIEFNYNIYKDLCICWSWKTFNNCYYKENKDCNIIRYNNILNLGNISLNIDWINEIKKENTLKENSKKIIELLNFNELGKHLKEWIEIKDNFNNFIKIINNLWHQYFYFNEWKHKWEDKELNNKNKIKCFIQRCNCDSIKSHIISQSNFTNFNKNFDIFNININNVLLWKNFMFHNKNKSLLLEGFDNLSLWLFCQPHDSSFKIIDEINIDENNLNHIDEDIFQLWMNRYINYYKNLFFKEILLFLNSLPNLYYIINDIWIKNDFKIINIFNDIFIWTNYSNKLKLLDQIIQKTNNKVMESYYLEINYKNKMSRNIFFNWYVFIKYNLNNDILFLPWYCIIKNKKIYLRILFDNNQVNKEILLNLNKDLIIKNIEWYIIQGLYNKSHFFYKNKWEWKEKNIISFLNNFININKSNKEDFLKNVDVLNDFLSKKENLENIINIVEKNFAWIFLEVIKKFNNLKKWL